MAEVRSGLGSGGGAARRAGAAPAVAAGARDAGVIVRPVFGALAVSPPLVVEHEHLEQIADGLRAGLDRVA